MTFDLPAAVVADEIALCGDFNDWSISATRLKRNKAGVWSVILPLKTGRQYRFRFLLDGRHWENRTPTVMLRTSTAHRTLS